MIVWFVMLLGFAKEISLYNRYNGKFTAEIQGEGTAAVIFVHDDGADKRGFISLAAQLASKNLQTVNFDLVGHGDRKETEIIAPFMYLDIQSIYKKLKRQGVKDIQCVGVGLGGILCMQAMSPKTPFSQIAIISPITTKRNQNLFSNIDAYPRYPLFVIAGNLDPLALPAILRLEEKRMVLLSNPESKERGIKLLIENPRTELDLMDWIWKSSDLMPKVLPVQIEEYIPVKGEKLPF